MRTWKALLSGLALLGLCLFSAAGCGGSDIPDASDAAFDDAPAEPSLPAPDPGQDAAEVEPADPAPAEVEPADPAPAEPDLAAPAEPDLAAPAEPVAEAPADAEADESAEPAEPALADDAPAGKAETNSTTAEMLALATSAPTSTAAEPDESDDSSPDDPEGLPGTRGEQDPSMMFGPDDSGQLGASSLMPDSDGGFMPDDGYGDEGFVGGGAQDKNDPGDTKSPDGAVKAFLYALRLKDRDRLAEATALRAVSPIEGGSNRELFSRIFDNSISDAELDDLASKLEGFQVAGFNQVHSTGRQGVTIRKQGEKGTWLQRTITVRKEKKGWGVLDISSQTKFDAMPRGRGRGGRYGGGFRSVPIASEVGQAVAPTP